MFPKRAYAVIDLDALRANAQAVIDKVGPDVKIMSIVKTDAYGHGAVPVARELEDLGVDYFGVASVDEGVLLRKHGIKSPILILGYVFPEEYERLIDSELMHAVFSYDNAVALNEKAKWLNKTVKIHIKVDTGMGRIGFLPNKDSIEEIKKISKLSNVKIDGIFTHFACADFRDKTSSNRQKKLFLDFLDQLKAQGVDVGIRHMDNSASIIDEDRDFLDMVRIGIMGYGLFPSEEVDTDFPLTPVMQLKSSVSYVKNVHKGFTVSYGSTFVAKDDMTVATVSIGYGDGYPRSLSNRGRVIINGQFANIIGRVCMDQFMVDVTDLDVKQGDTVTLFGKDGNFDLSVEELSGLSGRFNYELCCDINMRVPRVYIKDGEVVEVLDYLERL
ncbi:MAG: alanine racemase [Clostridiaceae bacterium]|nr:alanine racemase [Clostridiaceae bacterium]